MTHTIDAGIGLFTANCEDNLKLKMFLDSLKDRIEMDGKLDVIISFLDNGCKGDDEHLETIRELESQVDAHQKTIEELQEEITELEEHNEKDSIDGGVGKIGYKADNLLTQQVMEYLEEALRKTSPIKVSELLRSL